MDMSLSELRVRTDYPGSILGAEGRELCAALTLVTSLIQTVISAKIARHGAGYL